MREPLPLVYFIQTIVNKMYYFTDVMGCSHKAYKDAYEQAELTMPPTHPTHQSNTNWCIGDPKS